MKNNLKPIIFHIYFCIIVFTNLIKCLENQVGTLKDLLVTYFAIKLFVYVKVKKCFLKYTVRI